MCIRDSGKPRPGHDRNVAAYRRIHGQRPEAHLGRIVQLAQDFQVQFGQPYVFAGMKLIGHGGFDTSHNACGTAVNGNFNAGQQEGMFRGKRADRRRQVQKTHKVFHNALEVHIIHVAFSLGPCRVKTRAVQQHAQHAGFAGSGLGGGISLKGMGKREKAQPLCALGQVVAQVVQQAGG